MNRKLYGNLIFELSRNGCRGATLPPHASAHGLDSIPASLMRSQALPLPQVDEPAVVRHYTNMSTNNFGVDTGFYPLGSCTMKYNPKINEEMASQPAFASLHPMQPDATAQGALRLYWTL